MCAQTKIFTPHESNTYPWELDPFFVEYYSKRLSSQGYNTEHFSYGKKEIENYLREYPEEIFRQDMVEPLTKVSLKDIVVSLAYLMEIIKDDKMLSTILRLEGKIYYDSNNILSEYNISDLTFKHVFWITEDRYGKRKIEKNLSDPIQLNVSNHEYILVDPQAVYIPVTSVTFEGLKASMTPDYNSIMNYIFDNGSLPEDIILSRFYNLYEISSGFSYLLFFCKYLQKFQFKSNPGDMSILAHIS